MLIHAVSLFSVERGWKQARDRISRSYGAVLIICSQSPSVESERVRQVGVFESDWITFLFLFFFHPLSRNLIFFPCACESSSVRRSNCLSVSPGSALFHWMSQFLIDVFSKALLVQSLPVLVLFREITNYSANPSQRSHFKHLEEPVLRTAPRYSGEKI